MLSVNSEPSGVACDVLSEVVYNVNRSRSSAEPCGTPQLKRPVGTEVSVYAN